jgi:hypothetical protein
VKAVPDVVDILVDGAQPAGVQPGAGIAGPPALAEPADVAGLSTEVRLLRTRVEALEQIVKELTQSAEAKPVRR